MKERAKRAHERMRRPHDQPPLDLRNSSPVLFHGGGKYRNRRGIASDARVDSTL
jgi:hypothetical protein